MRAIQDAGPLARSKARFEREMADLENKLSKLRQQYDDTSAKLRMCDCRVLELQTAQRSQWTTTPIDIAVPLAKMPKQLVLPSLVACFPWPPLP